MDRCKLTMDQPCIGSLDEMKGRTFIFDNSSIKTGQKLVLSHPSLYSVNHVYHSLFDLSFLEKKDHLEYQFSLTLFVHFFLYFLSVPNY